MKNNVIFMVFFFLSRLVKFVRFYLKCQVLDIEICIFCRNGYQGIIQSDISEKVCTEVTLQGDAYFSSRDMLIVDVIIKWPALPWVTIDALKSVRNQKRSFAKNAFCFKLVVGGEK